MIVPSPHSNSRKNAQDAIFSRETGGGHEEDKSPHFSNGTRMGESKKGSPVCWWRSLWFWGFVVSIAYIIIIVNIAGVWIAVAKVSQTVSGPEDNMEPARNGAPIRVQSNRAFAPLPLLWAIPLEFFQDVPSLILRMGPQHREMFRVDVVRRDHAKNITQFFLSYGFTLTVTPDIGELRSKSYNALIAKWEFNPLWQKLYEEEYGKTSSDGQTDWNSTSTISSSFQNAVVMPTAEDGTPDQLPSFTNESVDGLNSNEAITGMAEDLPTVPDSFPLLRVNDQTPATSGRDTAIGIQTPLEAMSLPSSVVSTLEDGRGALEVMQGFPDPPVNESESIAFGERRKDNESDNVTVRLLKSSNLEKSSSLAAPRSLLISVDELFRFKMGTIGGIIGKTAQTLDALSAMGGAMLSPAINWSMSNPFGQLAAPLTQTFSYYGLAGTPSYFNPSYGSSW